MTASDRLALMLGRMIIQGENNADIIDELRKQVKASKETDAVAPQSQKDIVPPSADARNGMEVN